MRAASAVRTASEGSRRGTGPKVGNQTTMVNESARFRGAQSIGGVVSAAAFTGLTVAVSPPRVLIAFAIIVAGLSGALVIVARKGVTQVISSVMVANAFLVPMNSLRIGEVMTVSDTFLLLAVPLIGMSRFVRPGGRLRAYRPFLSSLGLVAGGGLIATLASMNPGRGLPGLVRFTLSTVVVVMLVGLWSPSAQGVRRMIWAYVMGSSVSVAAAFIWGGYGGSGRAFGLSLHPNHLGLICLLACGGAAALAMESAPGTKRRLAYVLGGVQVAGIVLSGSRGAILGLAVAVFAFLAAAGNWRILRRVVALGALVVLGAFVASSVLPGVNAIDRIRGADRTTAVSNKERQVAVQDALVQIAERPVVGSGFEFALEAHSVYLQVWVAAGVVGLIGFARLAWSSVRVIRKLRNSPFSAALMATFIGYLATGATSTVLWDRYVWLFCGLALASLSSRGHQSVALPDSVRAADLTVARPR